jgi:hypothetical protein
MWTAARMAGQRSCGDSRLRLSRSVEAERLCQY